MTDAAELFREAEQVFHQVMAVGRPLRAEELAVACHDNAELLQEVESLIRASEREELATAAARAEEDGHRSHR